MLTTRGVYCDIGLFFALYLYAYLVVGELDYYLETSPFESYVMYLGHISSTRLGRKKKTLREVLSVVPI